VIVIVVFIATGCAIAATVGTVMLAAAGEAASTAVNDSCSAAGVTASVELATLSELTLLVLAIVVA
jgi:hypothetical protein